MAICEHEVVSMLWPYGEKINSSHCDIKLGTLSSGPSREQTDNEAKWEGRHPPLLPKYGRLTTGPLQLACK